MRIYTIGFSKKKAKEFFENLKSVGIKQVIDVRLNNTSQLAGYTKRDDLKFFLGEICQASYLHERLFAPTKEILDKYKKSKGDWEEYQSAFKALLQRREVEKIFDKKAFEIPSVLLCAEPKADRCHRRLIAEYLQDKWKNMEIIHL
jgi:uncharacterized protein (DUF488 family)